MSIRSFRKASQAVQQSEQKEYIEADLCELSPEGRKEQHTSLGGIAFLGSPHQICHNLLPSIHKSTYSV